MKIQLSLTDRQILTELGVRLAKLRLDQNLTQADLAVQAGVSLRTVQRLETGAVATQLSGFVRICRILGVLDRLDALLPESAASPMTQLRQKGRTRQRASRAAPPAVGEKKWTWGEPS